MSSEMRAVIIDVEKQQIREEMFEGKTLDFLQKIVGGYIEVAVNLDNDGVEFDSVYVNEEGLLDHDVVSKGFFYWEGAHQPFAGNGVIMAVDEGGNTISAKISVEDVKKKVKFMNIVDVRLLVGLPPHDVR